MDKNYLLKTANEIKQVSEVAAIEYLDKTEALVALMNTTMLNKANIKELVGGNNLDMMKDNHANHARFMQSLFTHYNPDVFLETVLWVFRAYRSHGFSSNYWAVQLNAWINHLKEQLTEASANEILPYYHWMQTNIPLFVILSDENLSESKSLH